MSSPPQIKGRNVIVPLDGTVQAITTDTTIWSPEFIFVANPDNLDTLYVQNKNDDGTLPASVDASNCLFPLRANSMPLPLTRVMKDNAETYQLSQLCVQGPNGGYLYVVYPKRF